MVLLAQGPLALPGSLPLLHALGCLCLLAGFSPLVTAWVTVRSGVQSYRLQPCRALVLLSGRLRHGSRIQEHKAQNTKHDMKQQSPWVPGQLLQLWLAGESTGPMANEISRTEIK